MYQALKIKDWPKKSNFFWIVVSEFVISAFSEGILLFFFEAFGGFLAWIALLFLGNGFFIPTFFNRTRKRKVLIDLGSLKDIYQKNEAYDFKKKNSKLKIASILIIFFIGMIVLLLVPFALLFYNLSKLEIIFLSILYCLGEIIIGLIVTHEKVPEKRAVELIFTGSIGDTIKVAELIYKFQDVKKMNIELMIIEKPDIILMGYTSILVSLIKYNEMDIRISCAGYWGVGLEMTVYLTNINMSNKKIAEEIDIGLEFKPHLDYSKYWKGYKIQIIYIPAKENEEKVRVLNDTEWKGIVDLLFSTIDSKLQIKE